MSMSQIVSLKGKVSRRAEDCSDATFLPRKPLLFIINASK